MEGDLVPERPLSERTATDEALLERWRRARDVAAAEALIARHLPHAKLVALRICGNASDADDAVQEGLLAALRCATPYRSRGEDSVRQWLLTIIRHAALRVQRSARRRSHHEAHGGQPVAPRCASPNDVRSEDLHAALAQLREHERVPLLLHHADGLAIDTISTFLQRPVARVRKQIQRGLTHLRAAMVRSGRRVDGLLPLVLPAAVSAPAASPALPMRLHAVVARVARWPAPPRLRWWPLGGRWTASAAALSLCVLGVVLAILDPRHPVPVPGTTSVPVHSRAAASAAAIGDAQGQADATADPLAESLPMQPRWLSVARSGAVGDPAVPVGDSPQPFTTPSFGTVADATIATVRTPATIRWGPDVRAQVLCVLDAGEVVSLLGPAPVPDWYTIRFPRQGQAWVHAQNLEPVDGKRWRVKSDCAARSDANHLADLVARLTRGEILEDRAQRRSEWVAVGIPSAVAYIQQRQVKLPEDAGHSVDTQAVMK